MVCGLVEPSLRVGWSVFKHFRIAPASRALSSLQSNHMHRTLHTPHSTLHFTLYTLHCTRYTPHSALDTLHTTFYTLHFAHQTLHSTLHTLHHFTHCILHSTLYTLHFTLYTPYLTLYSLHSSPTTRHQHPSATFTLRAPLLSLTPTSSLGNLCYVGSFASQQPPNKASPQRACPSHELLHINYTLHLHSPPRNSNPYHIFSPSIPFSIDLF